MNGLKKFTSLLLTCCITLSLIPTVSAVEPEANPSEYTLYADTENIEQYVISEQVELLAPSSTDIIYPVTGGNLYFDAATGTITACDKSVTSAVIPASIEGVPVTAIGNYSFDDTNISSVVFPDTLTRIGIAAFLGCRNLNEVSFPSSVTKIDDDAFSYCTSLTSIEIPSSVTSLGIGTFRGCSALSTVVLPNSITEISGYLFGSCTSLTSIIIPEGIKSINHYAFSGSTALETIYIPKSVTYIGAQVFADSVKDVYYGGTTAGWRNLARFSTALENATVHYTYSSPTGGPSEQLTPIPVEPGMYCLYVVDMNGNPIEGATVKYNTTEKPTSKDGTASFPLLDTSNLGKPLIRIEKIGYNTWQNEFQEWEKQTLNVEVVTLYPKNFDLYALRWANFSRETDTPGVSLGTDLLTQYKTVTIGAPGFLSPDRKPFDLTFATYAADTVSYELWQGDAKIATSTNGFFENLSADQFSPGFGCFIRINTPEGKEIDFPINLFFVESDLPQQNSIDICSDKTSFTVDSDIPFLGGTNVDLSFPLLPLTYKQVGDQIYVGINADLSDDEEPTKDLRQLLEKLKRAPNADAIGARDKKKLMDTIKDLPEIEMPGGTPTFSVAGYLTGNIYESVYDGEIYFVLDGDATYSSTTLIWVIPVTYFVDVEYATKFGGGFAYNLKLGKFTSESLNWIVEAALTAFGGVGIEKKLSGGVYGTAKLTTSVHILGEPQKIDYVTLAGHLGMRGHFADQSAALPFAYQTWLLYPKVNTAKTRSLMGSAKAILYDASNYQPVDFSYLNDESEWNSSFLSMLNTDPGTSLTPLLQNTYQNMQPVMVTADDALYAAFLRADPSGNIYTAYTKFDGTAWSAPVAAEENAFLDNAPALCVDNSGKVWLAYARTTADFGVDLAAYATNQTIVVGYIDPNTLAFTETATYPGRGYAHFQQLAIVNGVPTLVWADTPVTDVSSVFLPESGTIFYATYDGQTWSDAAVLAETDETIYNLVAGEKDGELAVACSLEGGIYLLPENSLLTECDTARVTYGVLPGTDEADFFWNEPGLLCTADFQTEIPGLTGEYAVAGAHLYFSMATGNHSNLMAARNDGGTWGVPVRLTDGNRYLENLSAASLNGDDYVLGMHTQVDIGETELNIETDLVWAPIMPVSDLKLEDVFFETEALVAGEDTDVSLLITNCGDHEVTSVDVTLNGVTTKYSCIIPADESAELVTTLSCPETETAYTYAVCESGEVDFTPEDNTRTVEMGLPDLSVVLTHHQLGENQWVVVSAVNEGVAPADGMLILLDANGNQIAESAFTNLAAGESCAAIFRLTQATAGYYGGTLSASVETSAEELYTYNNSASAFIASQPSEIASVSAESGRISTQIFVDNTENAQVFCATYNADGAMVEIIQTKLLEGENNISFKLKSSEEIASAHIYAVNKDFTPLCESKCISVS